MTNERPEESASAMDGAGEEVDFHQTSAGKSLGLVRTRDLLKAEKEGKESS